MLTRLQHYFHSAKNHKGFRRYFANTSWMFGEQILRMVAGLLLGIWVARYLGPGSFGLFSYAAAFVALFGSISKLGLDGIVIRDLILEPDQRDLYLGTTFWLKLVGSVVMIAVIALAVRFTSNDSTTNMYVLIISIGALFQSFEVIDFYFQSKVLSKFVSICKIIQLCISSLLKLYFIYIGADLSYFVLVSLIDQVTLGLSLYVAYRHQKIGIFYREFDFNLAKSLIRNSWPIFVSSLFLVIYMRIGQIMIKEMLGEKDAGLYSAATSISEVWYFIPMLIANSLFPSIINAKSISFSLYDTRLRRLYAFMFWIAISIALPITFCSGWVMTTLYGEAYQEAGQVLMVQIWAGVFVFLGVVSSKWLIAESLQKYFIINTFTGAVANVFLNLLLIPKYGILGAAISTVLTQALVSCFMNVLFKSTRSNFFRMIESINIFILIAQGFGLLRKYRKYN